MTENEIIEHYQKAVTDYDEMLDQNGNIRPHWKHFIQSFSKLTESELIRRPQEIRRLFRENGVIYNLHEDPAGTFRPWELDLVPLLIGSDEWALIESGLMQRGELYNLILSDLYGPRKLIANGQLPPELIFSGGGFLRQCDQITIPGNHQLLIHAVDLARGPDNRMWVVGDRTQTPSGVGYALENRTTLSRVLPSLFRDCQVHRLALFFRTFRNTLESISPGHKENARIVVLTPGPQYPTYFEHAFLTSYLGYTLVQGSDLTVRDGSVWLKSIDALQPVDIVFRRVVDRECDPLELEYESTTGVPGLLAAVRAGAAIVVNPLGSGVLENAGLLPFLPGICRFFLGQELRLPSAATWWCGQQKEREYVLANLDELVIKPIYRSPRLRSIFGGNLSKKERDALRERILARPFDYVGQQRVSFSTSPSLIRNRLEPRHTVLRTFLTAREDSYVVMPGGLAINARDRESFMVSYDSRGISKDTWVIATEPEKHWSLPVKSARHESTAAIEAVLPSRSAENLYWVGRYAERAESTARLLRTVLRKIIDSNESGDDSEIACLGYLLRSSTRLMSAYPGFVGKGCEERLAKPESELFEVILDPNRNGGLAMTLQFLTRAAFNVRERWSTDSWRVINDIAETWHKGDITRNKEISSIQNNLDDLITSLVALAGLNLESMTRELGWVLLDSGRRLERSVLLSRLFRSTLVNISEEPVDYLLQEAVLTTTESLITYRRRYRSQLRLQPVLELVMLDETNPRSLAFQLSQLKGHISALPARRPSYRLSREERYMLTAWTKLKLADLNRLTKIDRDSGTRKNLDSMLSKIKAQMDRLSDALSHSYFELSRTPAPHSLSSETEVE